MRNDQFQKGPGYAASRPLVFGLSSQPFLKPIKFTTGNDQFQKGLGDSPPFQNRPYRIEKPASFQGKYLENSMCAGKYCQNAKSD